MNQHDQVIQVMERLGGVATLGRLNKEVDVSNWKTKTPYASIRRIVQNQRYFFRIKPGLWGLNACREKLVHWTDENQPAKKIEERDHSFYQGLLLQIGKAQGYKTFVPNQDKNKDFLGATLGKVRDLQDIYQFSYEETVRRARMIDVIWFHKERRMPYAAFEVEHSTDFTGALSKYIALQDFNTKFYIAASQVRKRQFDEKISRTEYAEIKKRVEFINYDKLADWHGKSMEDYRFRDMP